MAGRHPYRARYSALERGIPLIKTTVASLVRGPLANLKQGG